MSATLTLKRAAFDVMAKLTKAPGNADLTTKLETIARDLAELGDSENSRIILNFAAGKYR